MIIVVSGTHASGKTALIEAFATAHPHFRVLPDPIDVLEEHKTDGGASTFYQQLEVSAARLVDVPGGAVIAERGPLDFLAYLDSLERLGRPTRSPEEFRRGIDRCAEAMQVVDLLVLLHLDPRDQIYVPDDEDPDLRIAMDEALRELAADAYLTAGAEVVEIEGPAEARPVLLQRVVAALT